MKRAKDNSGIGYSYGSAIASLSHNVCKSPAKSPNSPSSKHTRCICKDQVIVMKDDRHDMHLLRTTAINSDTVNLEPMMDVVSDVFLSLCSALLLFLIKISKPHWDMKVLQFV